MYDTKSRIATIYDLLNFCMQYKNFYYEGEGAECYQRCPLFEKCIIRNPKKYTKNAEDIEEFNAELLRCRLEDKIFSFNANMFDKNWFQSYPEEIKEQILKYINRINDDERVSTLLNRYYEDVFIDSTLSNTDSSNKKYGLTEIVW